MRNSYSFIFRDIDWLLKYSHYAGFVLYLCYDLATETHLLICLNRFCAVWYPHKYPVFFSTNSSFFLLAALWIFCVLISITVFPLCKSTIKIITECVIFIFSWVSNVLWEIPQYSGLYIYSRMSKTYICRWLSVAHDCSFCHDYIKFPHFLSVQKAKQSCKWYQYTTFSEQKPN